MTPNSSPSRPHPLLAPSALAVQLLAMYGPATHADSSAAQERKALRAVVEQIELQEIAEDGTPISVGVGLKVDKGSRLTAVVHLGKVASLLKTASISRLCFRSAEVTEVLPLEVEDGESPKVAEFAPASSPFKAAIDVWSGEDEGCSAPGAKQPLAQFSRLIKPVDYSVRLIIDDAFIFGHTRLPDQTWQSVRPAINMFFLEDFRPSRGLSGAAKWIGARVGLQIAAMDFSPDEEVELMPGVVFSPFSRRFLFVGYGYNFAAKVRNGDCLFIGLSGSELKKAIAGLR